MFNQRLLEGTGWARVRRAQLKRHSKRHDDEASGRHLGSDGRPAGVPCQSSRKDHGLTVHWFAHPMRTRCDLLLANAHVLTLDDRFTVHTRGSVAIGGNTILAVGDVAADYQPTETVDCEGRIVMPGLVNAHTHAPMTLLRGLADDLRLDVWLMGYMMPVERAFVRPEFVALGTKLACAEMIQI